MRRFVGRMADSTLFRRYYLRREAAEAEMTWVLARTGRPDRSKILVLCVFNFALSEKWTNQAYGR